MVDDNQDAALTMADMLELLGDEVRTAHDGLDAIATAESFLPEIIFMDVGMPRLNGYDATRRIRAQSWGKQMTIVTLTGWGQEADRARSRAAGCDAHLVKPVSLDDLGPLAGIPTLVVAGDDDRIVRPALSRELAAARCSASSTLIRAASWRMTAWAASAIST